MVKLGEQSIHIIVLGFSSATIIEEDIREEFSYKVVSISQLLCCLSESNGNDICYATFLFQKHGTEVYASTSNRRHKIEIGTIIRFVVKW